MKKGYSLDLRKRAVDMVLNGKRTMREVSNLLKISYKTIGNWVELYKKTGNIVSINKTKRKPYKLDWEALKQDVEKNTDSYLSERAEKFNVSISGIWNALNNMNLTHKKKSFTYKEKDEEKVKSYQEELSKIDKCNIVYLDEFGINQKIDREYGWSKIGERILDTITGKREKKINGVAGYINNTIISPFIYTGTMNTDLFTKYVENCLLPELQAGQTVIMDNASFHKSPKTKKMIEEKGCHLLFLPPYSPDLNQIEHIWALLKSEVRRVRSQFLSVYDALEHIFLTHPIFSAQS